MKYLAPIFAATMLSGCSAIVATNTPQIYAINSAYNPESHAVRDGDNIIQGNAVLRTRGGEVRTCAGFVAKIVPATPYSGERMTGVYGNSVRGYRDASRGVVNFSPENSHYTSVAGRSTICDSSGNFEFKNVADGEYYLITQVIWQSPGEYALTNQGGSLMTKVSVRGGQTERTVLTN